MRLDGLRPRVIVEAIQHSKHAQSLRGLQRAGVPLEPVAGTLLLRPQREVRYAAAKTDTGVTHRVSPGARLIRRGRVLPDCLELRLLLLAQLAIEVVQRGQHDDDGLLRCTPAACGRLRAAPAARRSLRWSGTGCSACPPRAPWHLGAPQGFGVALQSDGSSPRSRRSAIAETWAWPALHVPGESVIRGFRGPLPALIVAKRIQPRLLLVVEQVVEFLQRRLNRIGCGDHRLNSLLHQCETAGCGRRDFGRARGTDGVSGFRRGRWQSSSAAR